MIALALLSLLNGSAFASSSLFGVTDRDMHLAQIGVSSEDQKRADIRLQLAVGYYEQRQYSVVIEEATLALRAAPGFADAYSVRALAYAELGQSDLAERDFLRALRLAPGNPDLSNNYGWFLCRGNRASQAMPYFVSAFGNRAYQTPGKALANAGVCSLKLNDVKAAESYFSRAFEYDPASLVTNVGLTRLYFDRQEFERARFHLGVAAQNHVLDVGALWLAIKIERKLGNQSAESDFVAQLRRRYPSSSEYAAYQRGAFDE